MIARRATYNDVPRVIEMAGTFWKSTGYPIPVDDDTIADTAHNCMQQGLLIVLEVNGAVEGFVAGVASPCIANKNVLVGCELAWWIEPAFRNASGGQLLLQAIENAAKEIGVYVWSMMALANSNPAAYKIYEDAGYQKSEQTFTKAL